MNDSSAAAAVAVATGDPLTAVRWVRRLSSLPPGAECRRLLRRTAATLPP